jgi:hypothetical protein
VWGENGESVYGGNQQEGELVRFNRQFLVNTYYEGQEDSGKFGPWWKIPSQETLDKIYSTWWSAYFKWDPQEHAIFAKQKVGLEMLVGGSIGTFTSHSQLDDMLQDLHAFLMFCKYGMGRCTSDASIEIRHNRMSREQGVQVVRKLDGTFPAEYLAAYLAYFGMSELEFWDVIGRHTNGNILNMQTDKEFFHTRPYILKQEVQ